MKDLRFDIITYDNLDLACEIQNAIFPEEDARNNFIEQIEKDPYRKEMEYYICYYDNTPVGVSGIYSYHEYPTDAWLGWYGVLEKKRCQGIGSLILEKTMDIAKKKGYENFRLYTDEYAKDAHKIYKKHGMIGEKYDNPLDKDNYLDWDIYIYSVGLNGNKVDAWNNKNLGLKEQSDKEH